MAGAGYKPAVGESRHVFRTLKLELYPIHAARNVSDKQGVQVLITRVSVILLASRVNRCLHQSWQTAKVTLRSPQAKPWRACDHRRCCARLNQLSRSLSGTLTAPGAVRFNHPHLDLVKSIGVCSASPPTPYSQAGALF